MKETYNYDLSFKRMFLDIFKNENVSVNGRMYPPKLIVYTMFLLFALLGLFTTLSSIYLVITFSLRLGESMTTVFYRQDKEYFHRSPFHGNKRYSTEEWKKKYSPLEKKKYYVKGNGNHFKEISSVEAKLFFNISTMGFIAFCGMFVSGVLYYWICYKTKSLPH